MGPRHQSDIAIDLEKTPNCESETHRALRNSKKNLLLLKESINHTEKFEVKQTQSAAPAKRFNHHELNNLVTFREHHQMKQEVTSSSHTCKHIRKVYRISSQSS